MLSDLFRLAAAMLSIGLLSDQRAIVWIRTDSPGISDPDMLSHVQAENRILLTFDKDFGELAF